MYTLCIIFIVSFISFLFIGLIVFLEGEYGGLYLILASLLFGCGFLYTGKYGNFEYETRKINDFKYLKTENSVIVYFNEIDEFSVVENDVKFYNSVDTVKNINVKVYKNILGNYNGNIEVIN
jgi:hypothetical protein